MSIALLQLHRRGGHLHCHWCVCFWIITDRGSFRGDLRRGVGRRAVETLGVSVVGQAVKTVPIAAVAPPERGRDGGFEIRKNLEIVDAILIELAWDSASAGASKGFQSLGGPFALFLKDISSFFDFNDRRGFVSMFQFKRVWVGVEIGFWDLFSKERGTTRFQT